MRAIVSSLTVRSAVHLLDLLWTGFCDCPIAASTACLVLDLTSAVGCREAESGSTWVRIPG